MRSSGFPLVLWYLLATASSQDTGSFRGMQYQAFIVSAQSDLEMKVVQVAPNIHHALTLSSSFGKHETNGIQTQRECWKEGVLAVVFCFLIREYTVNLPTFLWFLAVSSLALPLKRSDRAIKKSKKSPVILGPGVIIFCFGRSLLTPGLDYTRLFISLTAGLQGNYAVVLFLFLGNNSYFL